MSPADIWPALLHRATGRGADNAALEALSLVEARRGALTLRLVDRTASALVKNRLRWIGEQASELAGADVALEVEGLEEESARSAADDAAASHEAMQNPVVRRAAELFEARVAGVRTRKDEE